MDLEKDGLPRVFDCHLDTPTYLFTRGDEKRPRTDRPLTPGVPLTVDWRRNASAPAPIALQVGGDWPTGVYFVQLTADDGRLGYAPLVVRPLPATDSTSAPAAPSMVRFSLSLLMMR